VQKRFNQPCEEIIGASKREAYHPVEAQTPLSQLIEIMLRNKCHRMPVLGDGGDIQTVVTQSKILQLILENINLFTCAHKTINSLGLAIKEVHTINNDSAALRAFHSIIKLKVSGLAVVNEQKIIIGNISASDLKNIGTGGESVGRLLLPLDQFLQLDGNPMPLHSVTKDDTFAQVVEKCVHTKSHRVFVVGSNCVPEGVISLSDILRTAVA